MDTTVVNEKDQQTLLLKPDAAYLADPNTTYPVTIQSAFSITPTARLSTPVALPRHMKVSATAWTPPGGWARARRFDLPTIQVGIMVYP